MPSQQTDHLIQLIKSLTKGEKRSFRLFVNRDNPGGNKLFMKVFDVMSSQETYKEDALFQKIPDLKKSQLSNIKAHLYKQILISLRNHYRNADQDIIIREQLDYARVLYSKGLYKQSLDLLDKAKKGALSHQNYSLALNIINFERHIEAQHITGSMSGKATEIKELSEEIVRKVAIQNDLSNFSLSLYGFYLRYGYVKDKKDFRFVKEYFEAHHPSVEIINMDFYEKLVLFQSYVWYYNMIQDFPNYFRYAHNWVQLFEENEEKKYLDTAIYLKGIHNQLNALFMLQRHDKFLPLLKQLQDLIQNDKLIRNHNLKSLWTLISYLHGINDIYLTADYHEGVEYIKPLESLLESNIYNWDLNRIIVFYYKIACVYFGADDWERTIFYLNKITNNYYPDFRGDIQCFARILNLIAHFELGNDLLVSYQVKSVYRFFIKMEDMGEVQKEIFAFIKRIPRMQQQDLMKEFKILQNKLIVLRDDPYERRPFLYLDIISWLKSKIKDITMQEAIKESILRKY